MIFFFKLNQLKSNQKIIYLIYSCFLFNFGSDDDELNTTVSGVEAALELERVNAELGRVKNELAAANIENIELTSRIQAHDDDPLI